MVEGWISLHRKFIDWEWFDDLNMVKLYIYLLLKANHEPNKWRGINIKRGQLLTGLDSLHNDTKITIQTLRTCLKRLESTNEINMQVTNKYRIITICNYDSYQGSQQATNKQANKQLTIKQQATNKQLTANNNVNNVNKDNNTYRKFAHLKISIEENSKLIKLGYNQNQIDSIYDSIENYKKNTTYKSLFLTSKKWLEKEYPKQTTINSSWQKSEDEIKSKNSHSINL